MPMPIPIPTPMPGGETWELIVRLVGTLAPPRDTPPPYTCLVSWTPSLSRDWASASERASA